MAPVSERLQKRAERAIFRFVNGLDWWLRDPSKLVGQTPFDEIYRKDKLVVRRYRPLREAEEWQLGTEVIRRDSPRRYAIPVLFVPPLMVKPFIFDLVPERSFVRTMLRAGFDVYLVDFGEPDRADAYVTLDHYVLEYLPAAVNEACRAARANGVSLIGYCLGGLFALMHASVNRDGRVKNIVTIASPIDSQEMGVLAWIVKVAHEQIDFLARRLGNIPGDLSSAAFKMMSPFKSMTRYTDLFLNMWNEEYVNGFDALNQWTGSFIDYPGEAFRQFLRDFFKGNKLKDGRMVFGDEEADLSRVTCPVLAFIGESDRIVPYAAARQIMEIVGSADKRLETAPGGHMGVFGGRHAPDRVWRVAADWLGERSDRLARAGM
ncbi:MAG: alpha/beta fold hydrolase [Candidatus Schekmanbacteria bacterium]|nr:alpha/beta fold hydrolase [Candidatus Schekmanbacteria bacterium]